MIPCEREIAAIMESLGVGRLQAINHLRGRHAAREALAKRTRLAPPPRETQFQLVERRGVEFQARHKDAVIDIEQAKRRGAAVASEFYQPNPDHSRYIAR